MYYWHKNWMRPTPCVIGALSQLTCLAASGDKRLLFTLFKRSAALHKLFTGKALIYALCCWWHCNAAILKSLPQLAWSLIRFNGDPISVFKLPYSSVRWWCKACVLINIIPSCTREFHSVQRPVAKHRCLSKAYTIWWIHYGQLAMRIFGVPYVGGTFIRGHHPLVDSKKRLGESSEELIVYNGHHHGRKRERATGASR
jgi:hypothetical protein